MQNNKKKRFSREYLIPLIVLAASIVATLTSGGLVTQFMKKQGTLTFEHQIESLNQVEQSLNTLKTFVVEQRENLRQSEQTISQLKEEQKKLTPIVQANREVIESLIALQAERLSTKTWLERALGFFIGVTASLVASLIFAYFKRERT